MIRLIEIKTGSAFWEIDGVVLRFQRKKSIGDDVTGQLIGEYRDLLRDESYREKPDKLRGLAGVLGDVILLRIGVEIYFHAFMKMFSYYTEQYVKAWADAGKRFSTNQTSLFPVFAYLFKNQLSDTADSPVAILRNVACNHKIFLDVYEEKFTLFWTDQIKSRIERQEPLCSIKEQIGALQATKSFCRLPANAAKAYLQAMADRFTQERRIITVQNFYRSIFGSNLAISRERFEPDFVGMADETVQREYELQCWKFIAENHRQLDTRSDKWLLFYRHGPSLFTNTMDFTGIQSKSLRLEVKYFMRDRYYRISAKRDKVIYTLTDAANLLVVGNPSIRFFSDVDNVAVRALYMSLERGYRREADGKSVSYIMRMFSVLSVLMDYLMSDRRDEAMRSPTPHDNPFKQYKFHNSKDYKARTPIIPEMVAQGIDDNLCELDDTQALLYRIFSETGMRMKEVLFLETDCLEPSPYEGMVQIRYKPYKTLNARRKQSAPDYHRVPIFQPLADEIMRQIRERAKWREELGVPYIFVNKRPNFRAGMINMGNYVLIINKLIKKHSLCDENGALWHFTSRQQRKTLAVTLIENGCSVEQLVYWLGHLGRNNASSYYAEVRRMKLAVLNTEFYRKKFDLLLSEEQLAEYSEEERRLLYMDFRLGQRRVEFGFCLKKLADGGCDSRSSLFNCVNCKNLCTGKVYLPYWRELLAGQDHLVGHLLAAYHNADISDYDNFKEYKQAVFLRDCYKNTVDAIEKGGVQ